MLHMAKKSNTKVLNIPLDENDYNAFKKLCEENREGMAPFVRRWIISLIKNKLSSNEPTTLTDENSSSNI